MRLSARDKINQMSVVNSFHPVVWTWFTRRFDAPTDAQTDGWPHIIAVVYRDGVPLAEDEAAAALAERRALTSARSRID